jgi:hypothetical protein
MNKKILFKIRVYFTVIITLLIWVLLLWDHFHGGVPKHHILANKDLPSISNWWGGFLLPLLTWLLLYRIQVRINLQNEKHLETSGHTQKVLYGFVSSLFFGMLLSLFFSFGYSDMCGFMILALLPIGICVPIYRAECLLGFVIGMTYTFGAILPTGIGTILILLGALLYLFLKKGILFTLSKLAGKASAKKLRNR